MLTAALKGCSQAQKLCFIPVIGTEFRNIGLALCNGSGLIQRHDLDISCGLKGYCCLEQDAVFGTHAIAHHNRHRRCKA